MTVLLRTSTRAARERNAAIREALASDRLRALVREGTNAARSVDGALARGGKPVWLRRRVEEALAALQRARNRLVIEGDA